MLTGGSLQQGRRLPHRLLELGPVVKIVVTGIVDDLVQEEVAG
jgi:hypothetical protein